MSSLVFGRLKPVAGSVKAPQILIDSRLGTTCGRARDTKYVIQIPSAQHGMLANFCPRYAFDVIMWYPGIEKRIRKDSTTPWHDDPNLRAIISTRTQNFIKINGVKLRGRDDRYYYWGSLRSGDVITIFHHQKISLAYQCIFFRGRSASTRPSDGSQPFRVLRSYNLGTEKGRTMRQQAKSKFKYSNTQNGLPTSDSRSAVQEASQHVEGLKSHEAIGDA